MLRPKFRFGRNFGFSQGPCFGFGVSAKNLFRLPTNGGLALGGLHGGIWKREAESDPEADASFNYAGSVGASAIGLGYGYAGLGNLGFLRVSRCN